MKPSTFMPLSWTRRAEPLHLSNERHHRGFARGKPDDGT
jgi:hypothetical protein